MTPRLTIQPGTPDAWEIKLQPGLNRIGRGAQNDFVVNNPSVSTSHCELNVTPAGVHLKDLGSTNGTFLNNAPIREATLQEGQIVRLGTVEMAFTAGAPIPVPVPVPVAATSAPAAPAVRINKPGLSIARPTSHVAEPPPAPPVPMAAPAHVAAPAAHGPAARSVGIVYCRFHKQTLAHFLCQKCNKYFCDLCVTTRSEGDHVLHTCRSCGTVCVPVEVKRPRAKGSAGFFSQLPFALIYPFKGSGSLVLIFSALVFAGLRAVASPFAILFVIVAVGYLYAYAQNVIHATAAEEAQMPDLPGFDDVFGGCFRLVTTFTVSFLAPIVLMLGNFFGNWGVSPAVTLLLTAFGCLYCPMGFLAVAMKDTVMALNPLFVITSIVKVPLEYLAAAFVFTGVVGVALTGELISLGAGVAAEHTRSMNTLFISFGIRIGWMFASVYLLTVSMRVLGLLYVTKKHKLEWF